CQQHKSYTYTF
nr:immunoglobulin light chain junction region [Macaca mulatta]